MVSTSPMVQQTNVNCLMIISPAFPVNWFVKIFVWETIGTAHAKFPYRNLKVHIVFVILIHRLIV